MSDQSGVINRHTAWDSEMAKVRLEFEIPIDVEARSTF